MASWGSFCRTSVEPKSTQHVLLCRKQAVDTYIAIQYCYVQPPRLHPVFKINRFEESDWLDLSGVYSFFCMLYYVAFEPNLRVGDPSHVYLVGTKVNPACSSLYAPSQLLNMSTNDIFFVYLRANPIELKCRTQRRSISVFFPYCVRWYETQVPRLV